MFVVMFALADVKGDVVPYAWRIVITSLALIELAAVFLTQIGHKPLFQVPFVVVTVKFSPFPSLSDPRDHSCFDSVDISSCGSSPREEIDPSPESADHFLSSRTLVCLLHISDDVPEAARGIQDLAGRRREEATKRGRGRLRSVLFVRFHLLPRSLRGDPLKTTSSFFLDCVIRRDRRSSELAWLAHF